MESWYEDIGKIIKKWSIIVFIFGAVACIIFGAYMQIHAIDISDPMFILGVVIIIGGPIICFISSWPLYAYGELVDKTAENENNTKEILRLLLKMKKEVIRLQKDQKSNNTQNTKEHDVNYCFICPNCGELLYSGDHKCKNCGKEFNTD